MRRKQSLQRNLNPDRIFGSLDISKMINVVMIGGNKSTASNMVYDALKQTANILKIEEIELFNKVLKSVTPEKITVVKRIGGSTYHIPKTINEKQKKSIAVKIIVKAARKSAWTSGKKFADALAKVLEETYNLTGPAIQEFKTLHSSVKENEVFSHLNG